MRSRTIAVASTVAVLLASLALVSAPVAQAHGGGIIPGLDTADPAVFTVAPGVEQVTITGATPDHLHTLTDAVGERLLTVPSDEFGQLTFSYIPEHYLVWDPDAEPLPADGRPVLPDTYRIVDESADPIQASDPFDVLAVEDVPDPSFYDGQTLNEGFNYLTTRDGVQLSVMVRFPDPALRGVWGLPADGPFPTVVEYSGYSPSNPNGTGEPGSSVANLMGFASVGVNIRGTGCSGGVFDVFNSAQRADGYDAIETIARQDWVAGNEVGMVGLSYSGILQLYAASTNPPSLAAITPLSTIEDPWDQQWPGGIYNTGFTQEWLAERDRQSGGAVGWVQDLITAGDTTCADNLAIRSQNIDFEDFGAALTTRPEYADQRNLSILVGNIDVPVYQSGGWQDEQTGPQFADLLNEYDNAPVTKFRVYNGRHPDGYTPVNLSRWFEHLSFYVKNDVPKIPQVVRDAAPALLEGFFGVAGLNFEPDRFTDPGTYPDYAAAEQGYRDTPDIEVMWDFGAGRVDVPGAPVPRSSSTLDTWPPPHTEWRQYLGPDGMLVDEAPAHEDVERYDIDLAGTGVAYTDNSGSDFIKPQINANWEPMVEGDGLSFLTEPLDATTVVAGDGYVDLWFRSEGSDAAIEVLLTEVYPNGEEVIVQHGLARASYPELDPVESTGLTRRHLFYGDNQTDLGPGEVRNLQVPIYPVAHPFRAGSKLRLSINTPGRDDPIWAYITDDYGATFQEVSFGGSTPSSLVLPVVPALAADVVETPPPCNSLRGQPCRTYEAVANTQGCASTRFADVAYTSPFCVDISAIAAEGITVGKPDGTFGPLETVTRQAMVAFLYRQAGSPEGEHPGCTSAPFPDVAQNHPFCGEIAWAVDEGITGGFGDGTFRPRAEVTRQEVVAFLYRLLGQPLGEDPSCTAAPFPDVAQNHTFCGDIAWAVDVAIISGFGDGTFRPRSPIARQAMAAMLNRLPT
jgi:predicted acyl esterase